MTTAASEIGLPNGAVGVAVVAMPGGERTVTLVTPVPSPSVLVVVLRPDA